MVFKILDKRFASMKLSPNSIQIHSKQSSQFPSLLLVNFIWEQNTVKLKTCSAYAVQKGTGLIL
jgi:hypothetical protein